MWFFCAWVMLPLLLMVISPINLKMANSYLILFYILLNIVAFCVGFVLIGILEGGRIVNERNLIVGANLKKIIIWGTIFSATILPVLIYVYTGKSILDLDVVLDQAAVYANLADALEGESGIRKVTSLIRGIIAPLTLAVMPLAAFFWPQLSFPYKITALVVPLTYIVFSAFRGTDKEIGDILILVLIGVISRLGYIIRSGAVVNNKILWRYFLFCIFCIVNFIAIFVARKIERMGGVVEFCLYGNAACFFPSGVDRNSDIFGFGLAMISSYLVQGYYGLSLAFPLEYSWTWGVGHSQPLQVIYGFAGDTKEIYNAGLMAGLKEVGWDDRAVWSSIFPNLASDIGFAGVPIFFLIIGIIYAKAWFVLTENASISAIMTFSIITILIIYVPANNQLAQSFDFYFASIFWTGIFILKRFLYVQR